MFHRLTIPPSGRQNPFTPTRNCSWWILTFQCKDSKIGRTLLSISMVSCITTYPPGLNMRSISTATSIISHLRKEKKKYWHQKPQIRSEWNLFNTSLIDFWRGNSSAEDHRFEGRYSEIHTNRGRYRSTLYQIWQTVCLAYEPGQHSWPRSAYQ